MVDYSFHSLHVALYAAATRVPLVVNTNGNAGRFLQKNNKRKQSLPPTQLKLTNHSVVFGHMNANNLNVNHNDQNGMNINHNHLTHT